MRCSSLLVIATALALAACSSSDNAPKPTPLTDLKNSVAFDTVWRSSFASGGVYRFAPDAADGNVYAVSAEQGIAGFDGNDGRKLSEFRPGKPLAGGIGIDRGTLLVGTLKGEVIAFSPSGAQQWISQLSSEVISPPVVVEGTAVVRSVDGRIWGLDVKTGTVRWDFRRSQPALILRNYSSVTVADGVVYAGLAGGRMVALALNDGRVLWEATVAQSKGATDLERIADVTSAPAVDGDVVCAVAFQGRIACFASGNGTLLWAKDLSSYAGLALDKNAVYVSDEVGNVLAYERTRGRSLWKQEKLYGRRVTAPVVYQGKLAVGDVEGVVHLLSTEDGSFIARQTTDKSPVVVAPRIFAGKLLVQTRAGGLYTFVLSGK